MSNYSPTHREESKNKKGVSLARETLNNALRASQARAELEAARRQALKAQERLERASAVEALETLREALDNAGQDSTNG